MWSQFRERVSWSEIFFSYRSQFAQSTRTVPPTPHIEPISSTESSSTISTPNSSPSNTSSTSSTTPSSPTNNLLTPLALPPKQNENKTHRHSMINVLNPPANSSQRVNRYTTVICSTCRFSFYFKSVGFQPLCRNTHCTAYRVKRLYRKVRSAANGISS